MTLSKKEQISELLKGIEVFRFEDDQAIEHWDTTEAILSRKKWKNNNGKF